MGMTDVVARLVLLVYNGVLGCRGTRAEGGVIVLGNVCRSVC